jgi:glycosyltransferase involved in cell wall biosynthesis
MKIAFVIPWYGEGIRGGAEMELREISRHLMRAGVDVEILTTCVRSFDANWNENYYAEGTAMVYDVPTRRFPVRIRDKGAFDQVNQKLMQGGHVTLREEKTFLNEMINSPALYSYLEEQAEDYDLFVFLPYMFGTTFFGVLSCPPEKAVMLPCFHNESYARLQMFRQTYIHIQGMIFNAKPEMELANRLYDLQEVQQACIGIGMDTRVKGDAQRFRQQSGITAPFVLYAGRKDQGKNVDALLRYFAEYRKRNPEETVELVLIGGGTVSIPSEVQPFVHDLGFVAPQMKYDAMAAAELLCQPSRNESFSLVIMESWLQNRPVLVHGKCAVTTDFVRRSGGGLYFHDYYEFEGCLRWIRQHPEQAAVLGHSGNAFVREHFDWNIITRKYIRFFETLIKG